jgi:uncharacterized protein
MTLNRSSGYGNGMTGDAGKTIWALLGARTGDNAQVLALAGMLDARVVLKQLSYNVLHHLPNLLLGASTASLAETARGTIAPPWPDMVIAAGKRSAPIARWIKKQSGGATRLIHVGRPRAPLDAFDLVITTPQYGLPSGGNVVEVPLPFARPLAVARDAQEKWQADWRDLPRPLIAVAIGAGKFPLRFGRAEKDCLSRQLNAVSHRHGGSVLLMASPRTPPDALPRIGAGLDGPHRSYPWKGGAGNPYGAALLAADRLVVTGDSVSMLADAVATGKPADVFRLPAVPQWWAWDGRSGFYAALARAGLLQPPRNVTKLVDQLIARGFAGELGKDSDLKPRKANYDEAMKRAAALLTARRNQTGAE